MDKQGFEIDVDYFEKEKLIAEDEEKEIDWFISN